MTANPSIHHSMLTRRIAEDQSRIIVDAVTQSAQPPAMPDWRPFAEAILSALKGSTWAGRQVPLPATVEEPADRTADGTLAEAASKHGESAEGDGRPFDDIEGLLAQIDAEATFGPPIPDRAPVAEAPAMMWRPKIATLLAAVRLAATFGSATALSEVIGTHGAITVLATGSAALDQTVQKALEHLVAERSLWPGMQGRAVVTQAADAVRSGGADRHRTLGALSERVRDAIEAGEPVVLITPVAGTAPRDLRELELRVITLMPLDRTMLAVLLDQAYPGQGAATALLALPATARVSRLDPDRASLALRAVSAKGAVQAIAKALSPAPVEGAGWAEFPLPLSVRSPLEQLVTDLRDWKEGRMIWRDVTRGLLLVGPPGSGKTQIARLIGQEADVAVVAGSVGRWSAESSRSSDMIRAMRAAFAQAAEQAPAILFIDELDAFGDRARKADHNSAYTDYIVTALIDMLDGYHGHEGVIVVGATNHLAKLDRAIIRAGRFDRILTLPYPNIELLPQALRWHLGPDLSEADLSGVARRALGMSGADIAAAVRAARGRARRERREVGMADLTEAIASARPPLPEGLRRIIAVHEAGHAVVSTATGLGRVSMAAIGHDGGVTQASVAPTGQDRAAIEAHLAVILAGRAAERLIIGKVSAGAGGDQSSDLATATRLAAALEASWGLGASLIWQGPVEGVENRLRDDAGLRARVEVHLRNAELRAIRILDANRELLEEMAGNLAAEGVLSGSALDALLRRVTPEAPRGNSARMGEAVYPDGVPPTHRSGPG